jgi:hypothetical protein
MTKIKHMLTELVKTYEFYDRPDDGGRFSLILDLKSDDEDGARMSIEGFENKELQRAKKATIKADQRPNPMLYMQDMTVQDARALRDLLDQILEVAETETSQPDFEWLSRTAEEKQKCQEKKQEQAKTGGTPTQPANNGPGVPATAGAKPAGQAATK